MKQFHWISFHTQTYFPKNGIKYVCICYSQHMWHYMKSLAAKGFIEVLVKNLNDSGIQPFIRHLYDKNDFNRKIQKT